MAILLPEICECSELDTDKVAIDGTKYLDSGETFSAVNSVQELGVITGYDANGQPTITASSDLTLSGAAVSTTTKVINRKTVAIGKALLFNVVVADITPVRVYAIQVRATTTAGRVKNMIARVKVM